MKINLFSKEFLDQLQEECSKFTIVDYIMKSENKTFHEAILDLAQYTDLEPEYVFKKEKISECPCHKKDE